MKLLITGVGRSGTLWAATALRSAGISCGHEQAYNPTTVAAWGDDQEAESSWCAAPWSAEERLYGTYVVHLVRDPRKVIASLVYRHRRPGNNAWWEHAARYVPELAALPDDCSPVERQALRWVAWNRLVEADERKRLEDVTIKDVKRWARKAGTQRGPKRLPGPTHVSRRRPNPVEWEDILHVPGLADMATEYGYDPTS